MLSGNGGTFPTPNDVSQTVLLNVGGRLFRTCWRTLENLPGTKLYELIELGREHPAYSAEDNWYFFDRNPDVFSCILEYYRTDEFHLTESLCGLAISKELEFWGLHEAEIEPCCWGSYSKFLNHKVTLESLEKVFEDDESIHGLNPSDLKSLSRWKRFQTKVWIWLEYPSKSRVAKVLMGVSMFFVLLSIMTTILETHHNFRVVIHNGTEIIPAPAPTRLGSCDRSTPDSDCVAATNGSECLASHDTEPHPVIIIMDYVTLTYFILELSMRFLFATHKMMFIKDPFTIIDIVCIVPQMISLIIQTRHLHLHGSDSDHSYDRATDFLEAIIALRTVRILRLFKLMKYYGAFKILVYTIKVSLKELLLLIVFFLTGVVLFACIIYYAEQETFTSIPMGLWWAVVTMTTVGYGDYVPLQTAGYFIGSMCGLCGVLVIAFTVPIVVNNFAMYYTHAKTRRTLPKATVRKSRSCENRLLVNLDTISTLVDESALDEIPIYSDSTGTPINKVHRDDKEAATITDSVDSKPDQINTRI